MQSVISKVFMSTLRMIFHSPLSDSSKLSDNAAKLTKDKKSRYKPSKNFTYTKHSVEDVKYDIEQNANTEEFVMDDPIPVEEVVEVFGSIFVAFVAIVHYAHIVVNACIGKVGA